MCGTVAFGRVLRLPYQPLQKLSASLSAADLQVAVMGEKFVGIVHPCKIYKHPRRKKTIPLHRSGRESRS